MPPGIDRLPDGKIRARYRCKGCSKHPRGGGQHSKTFPPRGGVRAAQTWLRQQRATVDDGSHVDPHDRTTVGEYVGRYLDTRRKVKPTTRGVYEQYAAHLGPLADMQMRSVRPHHVEDWVSGLSETLQPRTTRAVVSFAKAVFALAVHRADLARTPFVEISLPDVEDVEITALIVGQVDDLAAAMPDRYRIGVHLQAALGLRVSELLAGGVLAFL